LERKDAKIRESWSTQRGVNALNCDAENVPAGWHFYILREDRQTGITTRGCTVVTESESMAVEWGSFQAPGPSLKFDDEMHQQGE
jgi:hypothetical protein